ncbi:MAG: hypothetical protein ACRD82_08355 [Blastocatellia bacterium]
MQAINDLPELNSRYDGLSIHVANILSPPLSDNPVGALAQHWHKPDRDRPGEHNQSAEHRYIPGSASVEAVDTATVGA